MKAGQPPYQVELVQGSAATSGEGNVDVVVRFASGEVYAATFFTLENIAGLMAHYRHTGECASGRYFWSSSMIIADSLEQAAVEAAVADLLGSGDFTRAFEGPEPGT